MSDIGDEMHLHGGNRVDALRSASRSVAKRLDQYVGWLRAQEDGYALRFQGKDVVYQKGSDEWRYPDGDLLSSDELYVRLGRKFLDRVMRGNNGR